MNSYFKSVRILAVLGLAVAGCGGSLDEEALGDDLVNGEEELVAPYWDTVCHHADEFDAAKYGDLHSHSSFSDGERLPWDLFNYVDNNGGDFSAVTDHANMLGGGDTMAGVDSEFLRCKNNERNTERFAGECGIEVKLWDPHQKHAVVLFPTRMEPFQIEGRPSSEFRSMGEFLAQLNDNGHCPDCLGIFAHPASNTNWNPRDYSPKHNARMKLVELNGDGANTVDDKPVVAFNKYLRFLDAGFQVSPVFDSDTHSVYRRVLDNAAGAGIWVNPSADTNMRAKLRNAILANRAFANFPGTDRRFIKLVLVRPGEPKNCLMGSTVSRANFTNATFRIVVKGGNEWDKVKIFSNGGSYSADSGRGPTKVCSGPDACNRTYHRDADRTSWTVTLPTKGKTWFVAYAERPNGWVMSSPIWFR